MQDKAISEGYQLTEVGVIPLDWDVKMLGECFQFLNTGSNSRSELSEKGNIQYIHYGDIHTKWSLILDCSKEFIPLISSQKVQNLPQLIEGDLIIADASEDYEGIGKSIEIKNINNNQIVAGLHTLLLRDNRRNFSNGFKAYITSIQSVKESLTRIATGISVFGISKNQVKSIPIPLPPLNEQKRIAKVLSTVDELISALDELITKKRNIKQGTMQQLLTGKIRLSGFTGEWDVKKLGEVLLKNPNYGINASAVSYSDNLPTYIRITDISEDGRFLRQNKVSVNHPESCNFFLEENDIVLARTGASTGKSYLYNSDDGNLVFAGFLIRIKPNSQLLSAKYLKFYLQTHQYWNWVTMMSMRSGQPGINGNEYSQLTIPLPPIKEQKAIAEILSKMDEEIEALEEKRDKYKGIKQGLMAELLTGKKRLNCDWE